MGWSGMMNAAARDGRDTRHLELADLLRSRRDRLQPEDVGLPRAGRRRTRGLRREEVAQLAGVSPTYVTFLEQGRDVRPSRQVLAALAQALRLSGAERAHLFQLAGASAPADDGDRVEALNPALSAMVARLDPYPAYVKGRRWDVLAANHAARALFADWPSRPPEERNMLWWAFTDPAARKVYVEWEREASAMLARFRAAAARRPDDPDFAELIDRLHRASPEARRWWARHDVLPISSGSKRLHHPALGEVTFEHIVLQVADNPDQTLVWFSSADVSESLLAGLTSTIRFG
jgi:transcriptional regulator with XRE-family HTH domain